MCQRDSKRGFFLDCVMTSMSEYWLCIAGIIYWLETITVARRPCHTQVCHYNMATFQVQSISAHATWSHLPRNQYEDILSPKFQIPSNRTKCGVLFPSRKWKPTSALLTGWDRSPPYFDQRPCLNRPCLANDRSTLCPYTPIDLLTAPHTKHTEPVEMWCPHRQHSLSSSSLSLCRW